MSNEETTAEKSELETTIEEINQASEEMATKAAGEGTEGNQEETTEETATQETSDGQSQAEETKKSLESGSRSEQTEGTSKEGRGRADGTLDGEPKSTTAVGEALPISNDLLTRALGAGVSISEARSFPTEKELLSFIGHLEDNAFYLAKTKEVETEKKPTDLLADLPKLDPDVHDATAIERDTRLMDVIRQERESNQAMAERLQAVEDQQQEVSRASGEAIAAERNRWFDERISGLGEDFTEVLGTGKTASLQQESQQWTNREKIASLTSVLISGYQAEGRESPPMDELFQTAAQIVLREQYQQINEKKLSGELGSRATQHIERVGGQRATPSQTPQEFAVTELEKLGIPA